MRIGALEAGGTKMVCAVGDENGNIFEQVSIPTTVPSETMPAIVEYFRDKNIDALGVACFGPVCLDKSSARYGYITSTPKQGWQNYNIVGYLQDSLKVPVGFDTDVNGSALGEATFGCAKGLKNVIYLTIGTGIGAGIITEGKLLHGNLHPEAGHILLKTAEGDNYKGRCPYHGTCFEGLASGPAIEERFGQKAKELADREDVWNLEAFYIAEALMSYILILAPERIILGGGVMHQLQLFPLIRQKVSELLAGYLSTSQLEHLDEYIVPAGLNDNQGIIGCLVLGREAAEI